MRNLDLTGGTEVLTEIDSWTLLGTVDYGRLAVTTKDRPDIFPVNFELMGTWILIQTNIGHKLLAGLREDGWVAFEADHIDQPPRSGWSVVVHGQAVDVSDDPRFQPARLPWTGPKSYRLAIEVENISGRRIRIT
jgi:uncharacterized protein